MTSSLSLKPDFEEAKQRWLAFWEQEIIDRPCCVITTPRADAGQVPPAPPYMAGAREDLRSVAEQVLARAETLWWGGEAMPAYTPSFGPDMFAAWLGADLQFDKENYGTNWVVPCIENWQTDLPITLDSENPWWQRMLAFCRTLADVFNGRMLVAHLDLHSNMDALSAMRSPEQLCLDMMDVPEMIDDAVANVSALYSVVYDGLYDAGNMGAFGTAGWVPAYHPERTNTIQCDFAALIGPSHFKRFVMPALEAEAAYLKHTVYHYDGPECLVHLDDICSIPGLDCIQWTTGVRNKSFIEWMDLLKSIQAKGVSLWVPCNPESIKIFHRELEPNKLFYCCSAKNQAEGEAVLTWLKDNT